MNVIPDCVTIPFNLSILECKYDLNAGQYSWQRLLISPYWNVNTKRAERINYAQLLLISPYWNVNLGEINRRINDNRLLISPYWNVNQQVPAVHSICAVLLISPYWNVNKSKIGMVK